MLLSNCPARPTKGSPCVSSSAPGAFADEHQIGVRIADAEDDLLASLLVKLAAGAVADIFADELERGDWIGNGLFRI